MAPIARETAAGAAQAYWFISPIIDQTDIHNAVVFQVVTSNFMILIYIYFGTIIAIFSSKRA
ncbi:MAG: hypothetical protein R3F41_10005 [Gammaproteobacteria bacterium]|nr:hypothetical protein [Pseudomonadales bacterium]MCP5347937.1 hypothetical protein [Pseudomonadales bacterium]